MKKIIMLIQIFIFFSPIIYGQIKYEGTVNSMVNPIQFNDGVSRYYKMDSKKNIINVFNLDHTLWKSIRLIVPKNEIVDEIKLISQELFNRNEKLEIVYTTVWFDLNDDRHEAGDRRIAPPHYTLFIIDETTEKLLEVKDGFDIKIIGEKENKKLLVFKDNKSTDLWENDNTDIFSLNQ